MSEHKVKIRLKIHGIEVEYEGRESFMKNDLSDLLSTMTDFLTEHSGATSSPHSQLEETKSLGTKAESPAIDLSISTIATRMSVKTGPDLIIAACGFLTLVKKKQTCSRADIHAAMKEASSYYKASMGSNLGAYLSSLVKSNRLNQSASDTYALTAKEVKTMETFLA